MWLPLMSAASGRLMSGVPLKFEIKHADVDGFADTQGARFAGEVGFVGFQPAFEVA